MAAFSNVARFLTLGLAGATKKAGLGLVGGGATKKAGVSAPNPVATAISTATQPPTTGTPTPLPGPTPPDAGAARSSAMTAAQRAATRQRKRATGTPPTLATGLGVTGTSAPRTLLGY